MLDLIRMDLVRMRKMKAFIILPLIFIVILTIDTIAIKKTYEAASDPDSLVAYLDMEDRVDSDAIPPDVMEMLKDRLDLKVDPFDEYSRMVTGLMPAIFLVIFAVIFVNADSASGFIKTIGGQVRKRSMIIWSKMAVLLVFELYFFASSFAANTVLELIFFNGVKFSAVSGFLRFMAVQLVLHYSLICFCMMVTTVTRSTLGGMIIGLMTATDFFRMFFMLLEKLIKATLEKKVNLVQYLITDNITKVYLFTTDVSKPLIICGVTALVSVCLALLSFNKRDIV